jgi:hypothetical protein
MHDALDPSFAGVDVCRSAYHPPSHIYFPRRCWCTASVRSTNSLVAPYQRLSTIRQVDKLVRRAWEEERITIGNQSRPSVFLAQLQQWYPG